MTTWTMPCAVTKRRGYALVGAAAATFIVVGHANASVSPCDDAPAPSPIVSPTPAPAGPGSEHAGPMPILPGTTEPLPPEPGVDDPSSNFFKSSVAFTPKPPETTDPSRGEPTKGGELIAVQPRPTAAVTALSLLRSLRVERPAYVDYERDDYSWRKDVDRNGCDTRNDILNRDLTNKTYKPGTRDCVVLTGDVHSLYTGETYAFVRNPSNTDIDHVVALHNAHIMGAHLWPITRKEEFANDPLNLLPSESSVNREKSSLDASNWLPPNAGYQCGFVARQIAVKAKYDLAVQQREKDTMAGVLGGCPSEPAPGFDNAAAEPVKGSEVIVVGY